MSGSTGIAALALRWWLHRVEQVAWEVRRGALGFTRSFGVWGWAGLICLLLSGAAWSMLRHDAAEIATLQARRVALDSSGAPTDAQAAQPEASKSSDGRTKLRRFEQNLLPHADIAAVVQALLRLADDDGLSIRRGDYRLQTDAGGGFVRYQMTLPLKGTASAIHHFVEAALLNHAALALESVQFKRDRIESTDIEARLQWVLLTDLPRIASTDAGETLRNEAAR